MSWSGEGYHREYYWQTLSQGGSGPESEFWLLMWQRNSIEGRESSDLELNFMALTILLMLPQ